MTTLAGKRAAPGRRSHPSECGKRSENELLARYAETRSPELREQLARRFIPLARSLARRYASGSEPIEDLVQVASLGLVKAIDRFEPDRGRPFGVYAAPTILGELRRHFRDNVWNLRLPRGLGELVMDVDKTTDTLTEELARSPTVAELADELELTTEEVLEAIQAGHARKTAWLDEPRRGDDEQMPLLDTMGRSEHGYERVESSLAAENAELDEPEQHVLCWRFNEGLTQKETGRRLGVSQMQVSRIQRAALRKLLGAVRGEGP